MRVLLLVLVVLTWTPAVASAQANLCDPNWLERASGAEVRALLRGGRGRQPDLQRQFEPAPASGAAEGRRLSGRVPDARRGGSRHPGREHRWDQPARLCGTEIRAGGTSIPVRPCPVSSQGYALSGRQQQTRVRGRGGGRPQPALRPRLVEKFGKRAGGGGAASDPGGGPQHGLQPQQRQADSPSVEVDVVRDANGASLFRDRGAC